MSTTRKNAGLAVVVLLIVGLMNALFGFAGLGGLAEQCPDGESCADARRVVFGGLAIAAGCLGTALYIFLKGRRIGE